MTLTAERADPLEQALTGVVAEREWIAGHVHDETLQALAVKRQDIEGPTLEVCVTNDAGTRIVIELPPR